VTVHRAKTGRPAKRRAAAALASAAFALLLRVFTASPVSCQEKTAGAVETGAPSAGIDEGGFRAGARPAEAPEPPGETGGDFALERELADYIAMPETLMYRMRAGEKGYVVVDLRAPERFSAGHLRGAVNYPWKGGYFLAAYDELPVSGEIFLMSEDGGFGLEALRTLLSAGFARVYSIEGGMRNWPYADLVVRR
jgi:rhodanese-related sulfurtransferase